MSYHSYEHRPAHVRAGRPRKLHMRHPSHMTAGTYVGGIDCGGIEVGGSMEGGNWLVNLVKKSEDPKHKAERENNFMEKYTKQRNEMLKGGEMLDLYRSGLPYDPTAGEGYALYKDENGMPFRMIKGKRVNRHPKTKPLSDAQHQALARGRLKRMRNLGKVSHHSSEDEFSRLAGIDSGEALEGGKYLVRYAKDGEPPKMRDGTAYRKVKGRNIEYHPRPLRDNNTHATNAQLDALIKARSARAKKRAEAMRPVEVIEMPVRHKITLRKPKSEMTHKVVHHTAKFYAKKEEEAHMYRQAGRKVPKSIQKYLDERHNRGEALLGGTYVGGDGGIYCGGIYVGGY